MLSFSLFMLLIFISLLTPLDFRYVNARFVFCYTMLLIFTHCLPPSTSGVLTVCRFVKDRIVTVWAYWTCMTDHSMHWNLNSKTKQPKPPKRNNRNHQNETSETTKTTKARRSQWNELNDQNETTEWASLKSIDFSVGFLCFLNVGDTIIFKRILFSRT